jgi:hypothetical protein
MIFFSTIQPMPIKKLKTIKSTAKKSLTLLPIHSFPGTVAYDTVNTKCRIGRVYATKVFMFSAPTDEIHLFKRRTWADIQRRGSILAWIVILSVYGADTIAEVKLLISPFLR